MGNHYSLGIDCSTQGMKAAILDIEERRLLNEVSVGYVRDRRLNGYGISFRDCTVPPRQPGEAEQPPLMYAAALDAVLGDLSNAGCEMHKVCTISISAQQHGHVYLKERAERSFATLKQKSSAQHSLAEILQDVFSYGLCPIWKTSNTQKEAEHIRNAIGGKKDMILLSGSNSPAKFTGAVIRRVALHYPSLYSDTYRIQLISSFLSGVLTGDCSVPIDYGNGSGMSLMDYRKKAWSDELIGAVSEDLPGGRAKLVNLLPALTSPDSVVGTVAGYFQRKYGLPAGCLVTAGSGDNPQTKVLVEGDLLSIGTSMVVMVSSGELFDMKGYGLAMYDGIGRPFKFGGRHNGAMVWDFVRMKYGLHTSNFRKETKILRDTEPARSIFIWQPYEEAFPPSAAFRAKRIGYSRGTVESDFSGIVDSSLALVFHYSRLFSSNSGDSLCVVGGVAKNKQVLRRISAIWNRVVVSMRSAGAAVGAAVSGASAYSRERNEQLDPRELGEALICTGVRVEPEKALVDRYVGYVPRVIDEFEKQVHLQ
jgi:xylulokinase